MRGRGQLAGVLGAALILSFGCGPTVVGDVDEQQEGDGAVWLTMRDDAVPGAEDFLGPVSDQGGARLVESAAGGSILVAFEDELEPLAAYFHDTYHRCGGFATYTSLEAARAAIAAQPGDAAEGQFGAPSLAAGESAAIKRLLPLVDPNQILSTIMGLSSYPTRYYTSSTGVEAANWLRDRWTQMAAGRDDVTVELFSHAGWAQPSVIMTIEGQDAPAEKIVIGGHLDSITFSGSTAPGADDDASGVASLTEVARLLLADDVRLRRTVVFIAYAAEEVGLRGSNEIADQFAAQSQQVLGVMQLDMTNYQGTAGTDIVLFTDYTSPTLTDFASTLAATYLPELVLSRDSCGYACSDHASWYQNGYPTVLPFESQMDDYNPTIHSSQDTLSVSGNNADHATKFARLALAWMIESAGVSGGAQPGVVRLAQVAYDIEGPDGRGEFVELYNTGGTPIDVGGWRLRVLDRARKLPAGTVVPAGGYLTLARNADGFTAFYGHPPDLGGAVPILADDGDRLSLRDASGVLIDQVQWEMPNWPLAAGIGQALVRTSPGGADTNTAADWSVVAAAPH
jgi:leucyl aminopeptidase